MTENEIKAAVRDLTDDPLIKDNLQELRTNPPVISDLVDKNGNQYIDIVLEGGGTLGIALVGYLYALEEAGIRFLNIAGSSVGAVLSLLMAAGPAQERRTEWLMSSISKTDFYDFIDGDNDVKDFIKNVVQKKAGSNGFWEITRKLWYFSFIIDNLSGDKKGLNPGKKFHEWLIELLDERKIKTYKDLLSLRKIKPDGLINRTTGKEISDKEYTQSSYAELAIVTADITTETKVILPRMAKLYWRNPLQVNPADFVRASMSIPIFFQPYTVDRVPCDDAACKRWDKVCNYTGDIPKQAVFVDGGIMSNFPIDIFHNYKQIPVAPTFGVKLGYDKVRANDTNGFINFLKSVFWSAAHGLDNDFVLRNPDFRQLVAYIDYDSKRFSWLDFELTIDEKKELIKQGVQAAYNFLKKFNWEKYKTSRSVTTNSSPSPRIATPIINKVNTNGNGNTDSNVKLVIPEFAELHK